MAKVIMVQGTMSNVGKSLIVAGLCRVFKQDGYKVAPFKSQNMALNSYITVDGDEIGRAQAMQAEAAGIEPDVRMNPVLLKPVTNMGSQVIVNGKVLGNMKASEYYKMKHTLVPDIMKAYNELADNYDIIVIEGAGSPAEINLKSGDFVNMGMAKLADAPVLLVGDIDRGGVFAQIYGTIKLLDDDEQDRVKATIINKFRGDIALFTDGVKQLEELTGKPVAGVMPMIDIDIDDEDSLSNRFERKKAQNNLDIAVIKLGKISNFTDIAPFEATEGVSVRYIEKADQLGNPDMIIIPGSKNTIDDLNRLRTSGIEAVIKKKAEEGVLIFGICGGYQMLGMEVKDPNHVEGDITTVRGMELLPVETELTEEKCTRKITGKVICGSEVFNLATEDEIKSDLYIESDDKTVNNPMTISVNGYEIHMGVTKPAGNTGKIADLRSQCQEQGETLRSPSGSFIELENGQLDGCVMGNIYGTYLHGVFDSDEFREKIIEYLISKKRKDDTTWETRIEESIEKNGENNNNIMLTKTSQGSHFTNELSAKKLDRADDNEGRMYPKIKFNYNKYKESQYDKLADAIRESLNMDLIYKILG